VIKWGMKSLERGIGAKEKAAKLRKK